MARQIGWRQRKGVGWVRKEPWPHGRLTCGDRCRSLWQDPGHHPGRPRAARRVDALAGWDGFLCALVPEGMVTRLWSRQCKDLTNHFPTWLTPRPPRCGPGRCWVGAGEVEPGPAGPRPVPTSRGAIVSQDDRGLRRQAALRSASPGGRVRSARPPREGERKGRGRRSG